MILRGEGRQLRGVWQGPKAVEISQVLRILDVEGVDEVTLEGKRDPLGVFLP